MLGKTVFFKLSEEEDFKRIQTKNYCFPAKTQRKKPTVKKTIRRDQTRGIIRKKKKMRAFRGLMKATVAFHY